MSAIVTRNLGNVVEITAASESRKANESQSFLCLFACIVSELLESRDIKSTPIAWRDPIPRI
jgi:hypothetical protein